MSLFNKKKQIIIPSGMDYVFDQRSEEDTPTILIRLDDGVTGKKTYIALDPKTASAFINTLNKSPMGMFIKTDEPEKDLMYA